MIKVRIGLIHYNIKRIAWEHGQMILRCFEIAAVFSWCFKFSAYAECTLSQSTGIGCWICSNKEIVHNSDWTARISHIEYSARFRYCQIIAHFELAVYFKNTAALIRRNRIEPVGASAWNNSTSDNIKCWLGAYGKGSAINIKIVAAHIALYHHIFAFGNYQILSRIYAWCGHYYTFSRICVRVRIYTATLSVIKYIDPIAMRKGSRISMCGNGNCGSTCIFLRSVIRFGKHRHWNGEFVIEIYDNIALRHDIICLCRWILTKWKSIGSAELNIVDMKVKCIGTELCHQRFISIIHFIRYHTADIKSKHIGWRRPHFIFIGEF